MKTICLFLTFFISLTTLAQDKLYLLDGTKKTVKILEVGLDALIYSELSESGAPFVDSKESIRLSELLLVEYKNGSVEIFNRPVKNSVSTSQGLVSQANKKTEEQSANSNFLSINTLALCNADIAGFYEYILPSKKVGLGVMAAYNFNLYATDPNLFIAILNNGKKKYDVGGFINFYAGGIKKRTTFSFGLMIKYTEFSYSINTGSATSIVYTPATGSQLATLVNIGFHRQLSKNLFFKPFFGIGAFALKGDYKSQFNESLNSNASQGTTYDYSFLPKVYIGLNIGYNL